MNYNVVPSLEHVALIRTAVILWNQDDVTTVMKNSYYPLLHECRRQENSSETVAMKWREKGCECRLQENSSETVAMKWREKGDEVKEICLEMEEKVTDKVLQLPITNSLKEDLVCIIKPIGEEMLNWMEFHDYSYLGLDLPSELCWLPEGTVDEKQTAKLLIKDEKIDIIKRYKLACIYCLEDDVQELWEKIPSSKKKRFYSKKGPEEVNQEELVVFWTYAIMGEVDKWENANARTWRHELGTVYQCATEYAALTRNRAAIAYFLLKLTPAEREQSLMNCALLVITMKQILGHFNCDLPRKNHAVVLKFLLSQMNEQEQLVFLQNNSYHVLLEFLKWPCQRFFMEAAKRMWNSLEEDEFEYLLYDIIEGRIDEGYKDYNYNRLLREFWRQSPIYHKKSVRYNILEGRLLEELVDTGNKENIMFEDASTIQRKNIIFSRQGKRICQYLAYRNDRDLLKFFVQECISSKDIMIEFKEEFKKHVVSSSTQTLEKKLDIWGVFSRILDDLIEVEVKKHALVKKLEV